MRIKGWVDWTQFFVCLTFVRKYLQNKYFIYTLLKIMNEVTIIILVSIFVIMVAYHFNKRQNSNNKISAEQVEHMFNVFPDEINPAEPLIWGYFFTHHEPTLLEKAKVGLIKKWYKFVDIYISDK